MRSWSISPAKTELPMMEGANRPPSSLNQLTTARLNGGRAPSARTRSATRSPACSPAITPYAPSNRPPRGWESRCEPMRMYGAPGWNSMRANMLPIPSTRVSQPRCPAKAANQSRLILSSAVAAWRSTPWFWVAPKVATWWKSVRNAWAFTVVLLVREVRSEGCWLACR